MSEKNNGGSAFPEVTELVKSTDGYPHYKVWGSEGMSLRDYFAAKAMNGFCSLNGINVALEPQIAAHCAYQIADAMIAARGAPPTARSPTPSKRAKQ